jgi:beta-N-acetylhexosaminidase
MSITENIFDPGEFIWLGFHGTHLNEEIKVLLNNKKIGGIILFSRNLNTPVEIARLTTEIQENWGGDDPFPIGIDQEGGRVLRINNVLWPSAQKMVSSGDSSWVFDIGKSMGAELATLGFNVNFGPVLDVLTNCENHVIGDRSFGTTPEVVIKYAGQWLKGLKESKIANCGKHFPGHGCTLLDSHEALPKVDIEIDELIDIHIKPFSFLALKLDMIMSAHVVYNAMDEVFPGTISKKVLSFIKDLDFNGVIVSDDLEMGALNEFNKGNIGVASLKAGTDMVMVCYSFDFFNETKDGIQYEMENSPEFKLLLEKKYKTILRWRNRLSSNKPVLNNLSDKYNSLKTKWQELVNLYKP